MLSNKILEFKSCFIVHLVIYLFILDRQVYVAILVLLNYLIVISKLSVLCCNFLSLATNSEVFHFISI